MSIPKLALVLVCLMCLPIGRLHSQEAPKEAKVTPLFSKDLADFPGKEGLMITVEYPRAARTQSIGTTHMGSSTYWKAQS